MVRYANIVDVPTPEDNRRKVLHVGCGRTKLPPYLRDWKEFRLDPDPAVEPDFVASITDMSPIHDEAVEGVWCAHNLQHLHAHEVPVALAEIFRVLRAGGSAYISVPDLQTVCALVAGDKLEEAICESPPVSAIDLLYGVRSAVAAGKLQKAHRTGFTQRSLAETLQRAGFKPVLVKRDPAKVTLTARAVKPGSPLTQFAQLAGDGAPTGYDPGTQFECY